MNAGRIWECTCHLNEEIYTILLLTVPTEATEKKKTKNEHAPTLDEGFSNTSNSKTNSKKKKKKTQNMVTK